MPYLSIKHIKVELKHSRNYQQDCHTCENKKQGIEVIEPSISFIGELGSAQKLRLIEIADKCPVHKTLHNNVKVVRKLIY